MRQPVNKYTASLNICILVLKTLLRRSYRTRYDESVFVIDDEAGLEPVMGVSKVCAERGAGVATTTFDASSARPPVAASPFGFIAR